MFLARGASGGGGGRPLSVAEVHAAFESAVEEQRTVRAGPPGEPAVRSAPSAGRRGGPGAGWVEVAEAR